MDYNEDKPSYIIQNITLNYHFVSDIGLQFSPREVKDLTWEDPAKIKASRNLKDSLRQGILRQLTDAEYEKTMELQYQKEQKQLMKSQKEQAQYKSMDVGKDKEVLAETFDVSKSKRKAASELDQAGNANHPMSYVAAFEIAQNLANENGNDLTAEEFAEMVEADPRLVGGLLSQTRAAAVQVQQKIAYVATPNGEQTYVAARQMQTLNPQMQKSSREEIEYKSNMIRDAIDLDEIDYNSDDDQDYAEEIIVGPEDE